MRTKEPFVWTVRGVRRISVRRPIQIQSGENYNFSRASLIFETRPFSIASLNCENEFLSPVI